MVQARDSFSWAPYLISYKCKNDYLGVDSSGVSNLTRNAQTRVARALLQRSEKSRGRRPLTAASPSSTSEYKGCQGPDGEGGLFCDAQQSWLRTFTQLCPTVSKGRPHQRVVGERRGAQLGLSWEAGQCKWVEDSSRGVPSASGQR